MTELPGNQQNNNRPSEIPPQPDPEINPDRQPEPEIRPDTQPNPEISPGRQPEPEIRPNIQPEPEITPEKVPEIDPAINPPVPNPGEQGTP